MTGQRSIAEKLPSATIGSEQSDTILFHVVRDHTLMTWSPTSFYRANINLLCKMTNNFSICTIRPNLSISSISINSASFDKTKK